MYSCGTRNASLLLTHDLGLVALAVDPGSCLQRIYQNGHRFFVEVTGIPQFVEVVCKFCSDLLEVE